MNLLFVPFGGKSHEIPLYVLFKRYVARMADISASFLLAGHSHEIFKKQNVDVIDFDYSLPPAMLQNEDFTLIKKFLDDEEEIITKFNPAVVIESLSFNTAKICRKHNIPRISIQRTGFFRSSDPSGRNPAHVHSMEKDPYSGKKHKLLSFKEDVACVNDLSDKDYYLASEIHNTEYPKNYVNAAAKIVPGIPRIEVLPDVCDRDSYFFCGPLLMKDNPTNQLKHELLSFFESNKNRKKVFITTGLVERQDLHEIIELLLRKNYAVITTVEIGDLTLRSSSRFFSNGILPLDYVCAAVDLVVHHCGSGMYHYPLLHKKPAITIGTQCYDREDIALRLQSLHLSRHIPSSFDDEYYLDTLQVALDEFENGTLCDSHALGDTHQEIIDTIVNFDMNNVITRALQ